MSISNNYMEFINLEAYKKVKDYSKSRKELEIYEKVLSISKNATRCCEFKLVTLPSVIITKKDNKLVLSYCSDNRIFTIRYISI